MKRNNTSSNLYSLLFYWSQTDLERPDLKDDDAWEERALIIAVGKECLNEKMTAILFLKQSGDKYEPYRQEMYNHYNNGQDNFPLTVQEQHTHLDVWKPAYGTTAKKNGNSFVQEGTPRKKDKDKDKMVPGDQHYGGGGGEYSTRKQKPCFKCDQVGHPYYKYTHKTKESGVPVETDEYCATKMEKIKKELAESNAKKEAKQKGSDAAGTEETGGVQHHVGSEVLVPTFKEMLADAGEDSDGDDDVLSGHTFASNGIVESCVIEIDVRSTNHAFNQAKETTSLGRYDFLNDNQLTCDL